MGSLGTKKKGIYRKCYVCNKNYWVFNSCVRKNKETCSLACRTIGKKIKKKCIQCNNEFTTYKSRKNRAHCSKKCAMVSLKYKTSEYQIKLVKEGKHRFGDGKLTPLRFKIINSQNYKKWRKEIFERDNFTCQECKKIGSKLNADHIKPFAVILKEYNIKTVEESFNCTELWEIKNGRTLCLYCHIKTPTWGANTKWLINKMYEKK